MGLSTCNIIDEYEYKIKRSKVYPTNTGETKVNAGYITRKQVSLIWVTKQFAEDYINNLLSTDEWGLAGDPSFDEPWANAGIYNVSVVFEKYEVS